MATHIAAVRGTDQTGGSSPNLPASSSLTLAVGDVVHVYVSFAQTGASGITATIADGLGNTYTQKFSEPHSSQTDWTIIGFECIVTAAGTATPTATLSTGVTYRTIHALQGRPGSGNTFAADASTSAESSSPSTTAQPGSAMTVVGPGYASAAAAYYSYGTMSSTWGTLVSDTGSIDTAAAYKLISSSGSETPALVSTNGSTWVMGAISTKEVAGSSATVEQEGFRFGEDDGSESAHTWTDAQDTNISSALSLTKLIRFLLNGTDDVPSTAFTLRYAKNGGSYAAVPVGATVTYGIPTWQSSATPASGTGAVTWPLPSSFAAGDLLIWIAESANQAIPTAPTGATEVASSPQGTGTAAGTAATRLTVYAKIATGSETTNSAGDAGDHTLVSSFAIRGAHQTLATALHVVAGDVASSASTSVTCPGGTTTVDNCLIVNIVANATDTATAQGSAWANANLGSVTERLDFGTTSGNGGGLTVVTGTLATAGSIGSTTGTLATSSVQGRITLAIRPPATLTNEVYIAPSSNIAAGGEATTARLTAPSGKTTSDFVTGRRWDDENGSDSIDLTTDDYTEVEWSVSVQSPAADGDYFDFRVYAGSSALDTYTVTPRWTIGTPPPPNLIAQFRRPATIFRRH